MADTTTIEVRDDQAEQLRDIKSESGTYKTVMDRVLEAYDADRSAPDMDVDTDRLAEIEQGLTDIQQETDRMARSLETVEERTGAIDRRTEELGGR